eukprot:TRINITY_DN16352_c0_g1_i1.p1 TRINITY_DN16352_c0_g1~~TRINITY_DN16352_c0_g1_i1.p1  ORF type:complete len:216 (-),score=17.66 TRINITY_DN16352_c0_g1_i1:151-798(-)
MSDAQVLSAALATREQAVAIGRDQLVAFLEELHGWLKEVHNLELERKVICVAISVSNLNSSFEDKEAAKAIVLQRAQQKFYCPPETSSQLNVFDEQIKRSGGRLPWDIIPTGNVDDDEGNRAAAIAVISQYCRDFQEPLGVALWQACVGKDTLMGKKKKSKKNREMRYEAYRKVAKELGYGERTPLGIFELIIKTRWPEERVEDYCWLYSKWQSR